ncbi:hypothetical protein Pcinc_000157 [Petrolisthes cinctipes]|uniref:Uncharacterized protein n=1 Tax=Petrolisthes cinctipes TaxID=88211 RepID=A0AAE1L4M9_PETCI|nr:hypothetical protein Pcinc_000157 [Petrolisthes cinctipes]
MSGCVVAIYARACDSLDPTSGKAQVFLLRLLRINESESMYIVTKVKERGTYMAQRKGRDQKSVPWRSLITSVPLWATIIHSLGNNWCIAFFFTQLPTYMRNVLGFSIKSVSSDGSTGD